MSIGINVAKELKIGIGDSIEKLKNFTDSSKIKYKIMYEDVNNTTIDLVVYMEDYGVEINVKDGYITYIKSNNSELNCITQLSGCKTPTDALKAIKSAVSLKFAIEKRFITIEKFNWEDMYTVLLIYGNSANTIRVELTRGVNNMIFMHSISLLKQTN